MGIFLGPDSAVPEKIAGDFGKHGYSDMYLFPDYSTLMLVPWSKNDGTQIARVLCGPKWSNEGTWEAFPQSREICKNMIRQLKEKHGLELFGCFEYEFMMQKPKDGADPHTRTAEWEPLWRGVNLFQNLYNTKFQDFMFKSEKYMLDMGVDFNTMNVEYGDGMYEWTIMPQFGIKGADDAYTFKNGVKEIAQNDGYRATFMTNPNPSGGGCSNGAHYNHSLWRVNGDKKESAFYDAEKENGVSDIMKYWTAGLLSHGQALCAFASPTTNCYERIKPHSWAPINTTYGIQNRTTMVRQKVGSPDSPYLECRSPSAAMNPYLTIAAVVAAGMDGLEKGSANDELLKLGKVVGDAYDMTEPSSLMLPTSLSDAIAALDADEVIKNAIGSQFVEWFKMTKDDELQTCEVPFQSDQPLSPERSAEKDDAARKMYEGTI